MIVGWSGSGVYPNPAPIVAILRSWQDRFGAQLLNPGYAKFGLLVRRPPRSLDAARCARDVATV